MFECLVKHGCADLSAFIDSAHYSSAAITSGGFGDVWRARMKNGILVAVKCLRLNVILEGDLKGLKVCPAIHYSLLVCLTEPLDGSVPHVSCTTGQKHATKTFRNCLAWSCFKVD